MQYRIFFPFRLHLFNGKAFKEFFLTFEVSLESGQEQALAEAAGAAQEIRLACIGNKPNKRSLIHI
ncbi:putative uncharacterized protein [Bacteroides cellulosilyticus CAG:158]|nr:putative uncharacterized protein [Bacteroides cellulosilyticus CAG:158]